MGSVTGTLFNWVYNWPKQFVFGSGTTAAKRVKMGTVSQLFASNPYDPNAAKDIAVAIGEQLDDMLGLLNREIPVRLAIPGFTDWRRQMRSLEYILLMTMIFHYLADQTKMFRGLDEAARAGDRMMMDLLSAAPRLREALTTIFINAGPESAHRFVIDLKAKAPRDFWEFIWSII